MQLKTQSFTTFKTYKTEKNKSKTVMQLCHRRKANDRITKYPDFAIIL